MWGQVEGTAKITIAKDVLTSLVTDLPQDLNVGLVAYGHRRKGDCRDAGIYDVQTVVHDQNSGQSTKFTKEIEMK